MGIDRSKVGLTSLKAQRFALYLGISSPIPCDRVSMITGADTCEQREVWGVRGEIGWGEDSSSQRVLARVLIRVLEGVEVATTAG